MSFVFIAAKEAADVAEKEAKEAKVALEKATGEEKETVAASEKAAADLAAATEVSSELGPDYISLFLDNRRWKHQKKSPKA